MFNYTDYIPVWFETSVLIKYVLNTHNINISLYTSLTTNPRQRIYNLVSYPNPSKTTNHCWQVYGLDVILMVLHSRFTCAPMSIMFAFNRIRATAANAMHTKITTPPTNHCPWKPPVMSVACTNFTRNAHKDKDVARDVCIFIDADARWFCSTRIISSICSAFICISRNVLC